MQYLEKMKHLVLFIERTLEEKVDYQHYTNRVGNIETSNGFLVDNFTFILLGVRITFNLTAC